MYKHVKDISFPKPNDVMINMMPFIVGDMGSLPKELAGYEDMIASCNFTQGDKAYLSVNESFLKKGECQRRPGVHTDGTSTVGWGGGGWGGTSLTKGIYVASTDGCCRLWDCQIYEADHLGACETPEEEPVYLSADSLYWMTDRTPHESLPTLRDGVRHWFRVVADQIGLWYANHSTANPFGIQPNAPIKYGSKF